MTTIVDDIILRSLDCIDAESGRHCGLHATDLKLTVPYEWVNNRQAAESEIKSPDFET